MPDFKFMCDCAVCGCSFQMGRHYYKGKYIPRYKLNVCQGCYNYNQDGWCQTFETKFLSHLKMNNIPTPERNEEGLFPRE